ncbi:MAG TPA: hypothetical protein VK929_06845 [Longimicrobiales bacterium]|nr:hypothetical protein [Longimicrobiales bacterium]
MAGTSWAIWATLVAVAAAAVVWHYRRWETPGRGRMLLAGLRIAAIALILLLIFDVEVPTGGSAAARAGTHVLLDASLSMALPEASGGSRWDRGVERARARAGGRDVLLFGTRVRPVAPAALPDEPPGDVSSRLLPALQAVAEAGAVRVVVVTDAAIEDAPVVAQWLPRLGLDVEFEIVGDIVANRSLQEVSAPGWARPGEPVVLEFGVAVTGDPGPDSIAVVARAGDRVVGRTSVPPAPGGRLATGSMELRLEAPPGGGRVEVTVELEGEDVVPDDDMRTVWLDVADEPPAIALVSFVPDWEPRHLVPVLRQAAGLPVSGYLRGAAGQYTRLGMGLEAGLRASEQDAQRAVQRAMQQGGLVVLHGLDGAAPRWALDAAASARRLLIFPAGDAADLPLPVTPGPETAGEYYPVAEIPSSPVAPLLTELPVAGAAPLYALRSVTPAPGTWAPLSVTRGRQGQPEPALLGGQSGQRRWVMALGRGYWQWAFRGDAEAMLYNRLWGAVTGWLIRDGGLVGADAVRPASYAVPRGRPLGWVAPGAAIDSLAVSLLAADGTVVADTMVSATADTTYTVAPEPGRYSYRVRAFSGDTVADVEGRLTVERYSPEFWRQPADLAALRAPATAVRDAGQRLGGTPLRATAWPFLAVIVLLAAEWILRRRWGLR